MSKKVAKDFPKTTAERGWFDDFEGGGNQKLKPAEYARQVAPNPGNKLKVHFWNLGWRWDGALNARGAPVAPGEEAALYVEAKRWMDGDMYWRILTGTWVGRSANERLIPVIEKAIKLTDSANGVAIEYRVAGEETAMELRKVLTLGG